MMDKVEIATIAAIIIGPIVAVLITLWFQSRSEKRGRKYHIFNTIWDTHYDASIPLYSSAIRNIPIVFHDSPTVRQAWKAYMENVQNSPSSENKLKHNQDFLDKKHDLISALAGAVGISLSDREIRDSIYQAQANVDALLKLQAAQQALPRIADALEKQADS